MIRRLALSALVLATSSSAARAQAAQTITFDTFFDALRERTLTTIPAQIKRVEEASAEARAKARDQARTKARTTQVAVRAPSLATANATTAIDLAQAAINTSVDGADAGVTVNPLALTGRQDSDVRVPVTLAALKDGVTRLSIGVNLQSNGDPVVELPTCLPDADAQKELVDRIEGVRAAYAETCDAVAALTPPAERAPEYNDVRELFDLMRADCGLGGNPPDTVETGAKQIAQAGKNLAKKYQDLARLDPSYATTRDAIQRVTLIVTMTRLADYSESLPDCHDPDEIGAAATRASWNLARTRIGASVRTDLFQRQFGFNPDPDPSSNPLQDGRLKEGELRAEASYAKRGLELVAGLGYGVSRPALTDELTGYVSPSISIAWTVASLSGDPLYDEHRDIKLVDGALPPRLVLGVDSQLQYAPNPPADQVAKIQKVVVTGFADFRFSDKLAVRIGVPIDAEIAQRKADGDKGVTAKRDRQWSIPVFVATVIKL